MEKITLKIDGMSCGMCEAHINDTIRKLYPNAKKVSSSFKKGETSFVLEEELQEEELKTAIAETGYELKEITKEPFEKKRWFF